MDKEQLKDIIYILVAILFSILAVKLVIWLLPIIIIALLAYFIYKKLKHSNITNDWEKQEEKTTQYKINKKIIIDEEKD